MSSNKRKTRSSSSDHESKDKKKKKQVNSSDITTELTSSTPVGMLPRPFPSYTSPAISTSPKKAMASEVLSSPERDVHELAGKLANEDRYSVQSSPVKPAREMFSRSPGADSRVSGSDRSTAGEIQSLRNQVQWLTEMISQQHYITPIYA
jgi:hypothetical protein